MSAQNNIKKIIICFIVLLCISIITWILYPKNKNIHGSILYGECITKNGLVKKVKMNLLSKGERKTINDIILTNQSYVGDGNYIGYLNYYKNLNGEEKKFEIAIFDSEDGNIERLFETKTYDDNQTIRTILDNTKVIYSEREEGIFEYDMITKECHKIVDYEEYNGKEVMVSSDGKYAYYRYKNSICEKNIDTHETRIICDAICLHTISRDDRFIIIEKKIKDMYCIEKIDLQNGDITQIFNTKEYISNVELSNDGTQLLYRTTKELGIADVSKTRINIYDINEKKHFLVFESHYQDNIETICWGE